MPITPVTANPPAEGTDPWITERNTFDGQVKATANAAATKADAVEAGLAGKLDASQKGAASGVATLGADGKLPAEQLPAVAVVDYLGSSANQAAMLAKVGQRGDWTIRTDLGTVWVITGDTPSAAGSWTEMGYPTAPVTSVNGKAGIVVLTPTDIGAASAGDLDNVFQRTVDLETAMGGLSLKRTTKANLPAPGDQLPNTLYFVKG